MQEPEARPRASTIVGLKIRTAIGRRFFVLFLIKKLCGLHRAARVDE